MKKYILIGFVTAIIAMSAYASVWISNEVSLGFSYSTCEIILAEHLYEDISDKNIEFLEKIKSHGFYILSRPDKAVGRYLYLNKIADEITIEGAGDDGVKFSHSYFGYIPFCRNRENN